MKLTIEHGGKVYARWDAAALLIAGVPQDAITDATQAHRKGIVNAACRARIYAVASAETQMNMATAAGVVAAKTTSSRSDAEDAILLGVKAALSWVEDMRTVAAQTASAPDVDPDDDEIWPQCPASVLTLVAQF